MKKETKDFFDELNHKISKMTPEDFQKIEETKSDFFLRIKNKYFSQGIKNNKKDL